MDGSSEVWGDCSPSLPFHVSMRQSHSPLLGKLTASATSERSHVPHRPTHRICQQASQEQKNQQAGQGALHSVPYSGPVLSTGWGAASES